MRPTQVFLIATSVAALSGCSAGGDSAGSGGSGTFGGSGGSSASGGTTNGGTSGAGASGGSSASGGSGNGGSTAGGSSSGGSGNNGGSAGNGGNGGSQDAGLPDVAFTYDAPVSEPDACAATRIEAEPLPLDMYFVLDDSGSMRLPQTSYAAGDCNVGGSVNSRWCYAVNALWSFFNSSQSVGVGVALNYLNNSYNCSSANGLAIPPAGGTVAFDILPNHLSALQTSLNNARGDGPTTPTEAALKSIVSFTTAQSAARPGRQMVGVYITDGLPEGSGCQTQDGPLGNIIQTHFTNTGIPTFIIGMTGASFSSLDAWANGAGAQSHTNYCGGSNPCYSYDVGNGNGAAFVQVLAEIQKAAVGCTFNVPTPDSGILDVDKIDVIYTPGSGAPETLTRVTDQSQCGSAASSGWYYDDNLNPTQIILCPDTCTRVQGDSSAKIDVELGCLGS